MIGYVLKFILGGSILVLASYFAKSKNLFLSGIITVLPLMTIVNMTLQTRFMNGIDFHEAQKSGVFGGIGLTLFVSSVFIMTHWMKPLSAILASLTVYLVYMVIYKLCFA